MPEVQTEEAIEEKPKTNFLEKLKTHKWEILGGVLGVLVLTGTVFAGYKLLRVYLARQPICLIPEGCPPKQTVTTLTPEPTANWETYISKYGYSIKYPPNFSVKTSNWKEDDTQYVFDSDDEVIIRYTEPNQPPHGGFPYGISVSLNKPEDASDYNSGKREAEKWLEKLKDDKLWGEIKEEIIAGNQAIRLMNYFDGFNISVDVYHKGRKFMFGANIFAPEDNNGEYEKTFNLMLSTLHFFD